MSTDRQISDAEATVRHAFLNAITMTWQQPPERLVDALVAELNNSAVQWAFKEYLTEGDLD